MIGYTIGRNLAVSGDRSRLTRRSVRVVSILNWRSISKSLKRSLKTKKNNSRNTIKWKNCIWIESFRKMQQAALIRRSCSNLFFVKRWEKNRIIINNVLHPNYLNIPIRKGSKKWARRPRLTTLIQGHLLINLLRFLILKKRMLRWCLRISA